MHQRRAAEAPLQPEGLVSGGAAQPRRERPRQQRPQQQPPPPPLGRRRVETGSVNRWPQAQPPSVLGLVLFLYFDLCNIGSDRKA